MHNREITDRILLATQNHTQLHKECHKLFIPIGGEHALRYESFCNDFGPMNLGAVYKFCMMVNDEIESHPDNDIVVGTSDDETKTNACFLVGAYMIMMLDMSAEEVMNHFKPMMAELLEYCDISPGPPSFFLRLQDCWEALILAKQLGWISFSPDGFDCDEYIHYDNPVNGDMHVVVPSKIIAMKGPVDLAGDAQWLDRDEGWRDFSPSYISNVLQDFDVSTVVRLNQPVYKISGFRAAGIAVLDIPFGDCRPPPEDVVAKFLLLVESAPGAVAVHCKAGLGRTGTLIALHLMKSHGFSARQAIAWLRLVRPGSVIGEQQNYLCDIEASIVRMRSRPAATPPPSQTPQPASRLALVEGLCSRICCGVDSALSRSVIPPATTWRQQAEAAEAGRWRSSPRLEVCPTQLSLNDEESELGAHVALAAERRAMARTQRTTRMLSLP